MTDVQTPAVIVAGPDGVVRSANRAARNLIGSDGVGVHCWGFVGCLAESQGLPCQTGCVGRLLRAGAERARHTRFSLGDLWYRLTCIPVGDAVVASITADASEFRERWERLTPRERQVLDLIAEGQSSAEIADALGVRATTVRAHVEHMRDRFGVATRAALVARCLRLGLIG